MNTRSFPEQLTDMWRTRPVRLPEQGHIAGVCAGIGVRYGVDPVLVRIAFVVSTIFGGAGILLYLAGWVLLTRHGDQVSPIESLVGRGTSSDSNTKVVVLLVALAIAMSAVGPAGAGYGGSGLLSMILMLGGLWLLYQRRPVPPTLPAPTHGYMFGQNTFAPPQFPQAPFDHGTFPQPPFSATPAPPSGPAPGDPDFWVKPEPTPRNDSSDTAAAMPETVRAQDGPTSLTSNPVAAEHFPDRPTPPAWDPLGVAPFAWDLPEPTPARPLVPAEKTKHSRLTTTILGFAVLAAAVAGAVAFTTDAAWLTPARIGAIALAVIGLGLLLGAFLHRGYGLLVVTGPLIGFVVLTSLVGPITFDASGRQEYSPRTADELRPEYAVQMGDLQLDLRSLELTEDRTISVDNRLGNAEIFLPPNLDVDITCTETFAAPCPAEGLDGGADGAGGPVLTIDIDTALGNTEVHRA
ncbi:PspC domain-containing protein [Rhodococcus chondri]|uniref:PspC domain-containing protein n=1 Tax=Rhodococcus chondri TaxID=3065941 RepID=A0ABU7JWK0_9NOCA|nr:PspC domain-containing protein [Rhodococcus sp. CC-R104]MEE2034382.1 PspC domain-containing protein [Rhodococcus sp. CC-R104]